MHCLPLLILQLYQIIRFVSNLFLIWHERYWVGPKPKGLGLLDNALHKFFERRIGGNREDVEDLVQETFLEALKSLKKGQSLTSFRAWLYKIATRVLARWIDEKQKQGVRVALDTVLADESGQMALTELLPAPVTFQPEHGIIDNELGNIRHRFERTLRPKELAVFQLRHNSSMTFEEIGEELGIKPNTAKVQYHRVATRFKA